ncbi:MAG: tRNA 2-selenouridine(34) synthase MnmH [Flavobacteriales bacterium]|jgi:tRNA 2-selenouridine synthase|nr:tRNA 2-selenouridine(34) synthase MnmH [Flavobacteriales bacterium]MBK6882192.1 tRNA 2-selenouridine(34) synthase MnmH [Flavobacteriales bacterium]MBK7101591.1 tRNA 2-selenouridine(34) synthase MnmH [Flavobacteriales bacterium]MBK7112297.1 tRNA 2-selenouridine(34) synthase MnmH [Flavobacteriales bacterium]MBK7481697.1 tRNA 2-selenouridine(34) synthase MnmH [Flavobacteriales bacterium]
MIRVRLIEEFIGIAGPMIDVRSPGEFAQGHIPGATSMPLFTDAERAIVGTLYKQQGRDVAMLEGLRIVGPKLASIVSEAKELAPEGRIRVHCWRGGERSGSVAWMLDKAGFAEVHTLKGGYKAFRNHVLAGFAAPLKLAVMGGYTGTGKTELLSHLRDLGQQTIDLEALANHKGSSYGAIGEAPQPTTEHFENLLWNATERMDVEKLIWVEDESQLIGRVKIPDAIFQQIRIAPCYFADVPREERAARLVADYGKYPKDQLAEATKRIEKRIGPQHCKTALEALANDDLFTVAMITLTYYDKTYLHGLGKRDPTCVTRVPASTKDMRAIAKKATEEYGEHEHH